MAETSVSIIIPVYNVEPYVEDCIRSVMRQTYTGPMECIVVDDCGTDNSMAIVERLLSEYKGPIVFKVLHHEHNRGLSAARNTGIDAANSDYLFFLDSDDKLTDDCIGKLTNPIQETKYDIIVGDILRIDKYNKVTSSQYRLKLKDNTVLWNKDVRDAYFIGRQWYVLAQNKLYYLPFINSQKLRFKEGIIHEDILWSFQIACFAESLYAVNKKTYIYKERKGSITAMNDHKRSANSIGIAVKEMCIIAKKHRYNDAHVYQHIQNYCIDVLGLCSGSLQDFLKAYKELRPYAKPKIIDLIRGNRIDLRNYLRDSHYLLPPILSPYWHYYFYFGILRLYRTIKNTL